MKAASVFPLRPAAALLAAAILGGALAGCVRKPAAPPQMPPSTVSIATAVARDVPVYLNAEGVTTAFQSVNIVSQVEGQIVELPFRQGAMVKKGDKIAILYQPPFVAAVERAKGQVVIDQANYDLAKLQVERSRQLLADKFISQQQFDTYTAQVKSYEGQLQVDQAQLETARINLSYANIVAPVDGMVGTFMINVGNVIKANDQALTTIQQMSPIYADFVISESDFPNLRQHFDQNGGKLVVEVVSLASNATTDQGELSILGNAVSSATGTVSLRATLPNNGPKFWPNQPVRVHIQLSILKAAVLIPESGILLSQQGQFCYVIVPPKDANSLPTVDKRMVEVGHSQDDGLKVIYSGIKAGEQVVTQGQMLLMPEAQVMVAVIDGKPVAPPADAAAAAGQAGAAKPADAKPAAK